MIKHHNEKHGHSCGGKVSPTYSSWKAMMARCYYNKQKSFNSYGGRGIEVDPWWHSFSNFLADMGDRPEGCSIERVNTKRNYWKGNCIWLPMEQQAKNKGETHLITWRLRTMCLTDWAKEMGCHYMTLQTRLRRGWSVEKALTQPVGRYQK